MQAASKNKCTTGEAPILTAKITDIPATAHPIPIAVLLEREVLG